MRGYTKHDANRKLSKNIEPFTKEEIEEGKLDFENPAIMRIAVKWCLELRAAYDNTK